MNPITELLPAESFLEYAFVRWVLAPAAHLPLVRYVRPQYPVELDARSRPYRIDYVIEGERKRIAVELDGYQYHSDRPAFTYDRLRQNDLAAAGFTVLRFSYDAVRRDTARCVRQLQAILRQDPRLAPHVVEDPVVEVPDMEPDPLAGLGPPGPPREERAYGYFQRTRSRIHFGPLRECQREALKALANYYGRGQTRAACVMSVGAGKTVLGVAAALAFARRRALIVTPGSVIRGTFARALDPEAVGNTLYGLPGGPLLPGTGPPRTLVLDREDGPIQAVSRGDLLAAELLVTNFHALGTGRSAGDLLAKLDPTDIDLIVVDEAHIAATDSYQRLFGHFSGARTLLMSACFQRLDGRPIDADVVYRYRLTDAIADGHAKALRAQRFCPDIRATAYEVVWPDGSREEVVGRDALLALLDDPRKLARVTAKSDASIRQIMRAVRAALHRQAERLHPVKPRVLFSALGERHEAQIARIANEHGIACAYLHHSMTEGEIAAIRRRFELDSGDLQGLVQLRMLGQGYDFPPIAIVVPLRPYGSFSEFYQFIGRGVRLVRGPGVTTDQVLDVVYHAELGLDEHLETLRLENDMDPVPTTDVSPPGGGEAEGAGDGAGTPSQASPDAEVTRERGLVEHRLVHDMARVLQQKAEREREALAQRYAAYASTTEAPLSFEQFVEIARKLSK